MKDKKLRKLLSDGGMVCIRDWTENVPYYRWEVFQSLSSRIKTLEDKLKELEKENEEL